MNDFNIRCSFGVKKGRVGPASGAQWSAEAQPASALRQRTVVRTGVGGGMQLHDTDAAHVYVIASWNLSALLTALQSEHVSVEPGTRELTTRGFPSSLWCAEAGLTVAASSGSSGQPVYATRLACSLEASKVAAQSGVPAERWSTDLSGISMGRSSYGDVGGALSVERGDSSC